MSGKEVLRWSTISGWEGNPQTQHNGERAVSPGVLVGLGFSDGGPS
jgi:hypothetical protein